VLRERFSVYDTQWNAMEQFFLDPSTVDIKSGWPRAAQVEQVDTGLANAKVHPADPEPAFQAETSLPSGSEDAEAVGLPHSGSH
jgi:hypothetical protein